MKSEVDIDVKSRTESDH